MIDYSNLLILITLLTVQVTLCLPVDSLLIILWIVIGKQWQW
jgi:hypothetical protein